MEKIKIGDFVIHKMTGKEYKNKEVLKVVERIEEKDYWTLRVIVGKRGNKRKATVLEEHYRLATKKEIKSDKIKAMFDGR